MRSNCNIHSSVYRKRKLSVQLDIDFQKLFFNILTCSCNWYDTDDWLRNIYLIINSLYLKTFIRFICIVFKNTNYNMTLQILHRFPITICNLIILNSNLFFLHKLSMSKLKYPIRLIWLRYVKKYNRFLTFQL